MLVWYEVSDAAHVCEQYTVYVFRYVTNLLLCCRWEALTSLSMALRSLNSAIPVEGKNLVTGSSLGDALLVAAILLKLSALACDQLLQRLSADHQKPSAKERSKAVRQAWSVR